MKVRYQRSLIVLLSLVLTLGNLPTQLLAAAAAQAATITNQQASNDATNVYYQFNHTGVNNFYRIYIDTDQNMATGLQANGIGANYLLENDGLWAYTGTGTTWAWNRLKTVTYSNSSGLAQWTVVRADIGEGATPNQADLIFQVENTPTSSTVTSAKYIHAYSGGTVTTKTITYSPTTALFANPERGFYRYYESRSSAPNSWTIAWVQSTNAVSWLSASEEATITQAYCLFYLDTFQRSAISASFLTHIRNNLTTIRNAGRKCILRFAYTDNYSDANKNGVPDILQDSTRDSEPDLPQLLAHIDQLQPILQEYADVIAVLQAGFIGIWGEWYYTDYFVDNPAQPDTISAAQYARRKQVVDRLLAALPANRMIALRYTMLKQNMYGRTTPITASEAFQNTAIARLGFHNDAFLNSYGDSGTFQSEADSTYLQAESTYLPMGGEVNEPEAGAPSRSCTNAVSEMSKYHWSYINTDYYIPTLQNWKNGGCIHNTSNIGNSILDRLGYRFVLKRGIYPTTARPGGSLTVRIELTNEGFAAPYNAHNVYLILHNATTNAVHTALLPDDARRWLVNGQTHVIATTIAIPSALPTGSYKLYLHVADPAPILQSKPAYAIRFANANLWKTASGWNDLLHTVNISNAVTAASGEGEPSEELVVGEIVTELVEAGVWDAAQDPTAMETPADDQTEHTLLTMDNTLYLPVIAQQ